MVSCVFLSFRQIFAYLSHEGGEISVNQIHSFRILIVTCGFQIRTSYKYLKMIIWKFHDPGIYRWDVYYL